MTKTIEDIAQRIAVVISTDRKAKPYVAEDNPMGARTLNDLVAGAGILKHADLLPTKNKDGWMGAENLNAQVIEGLDARKASRVRQRQVRSRAQAERLAQINAVVEAPEQPDPARMAQAWAILRPLVPVITRIAKGKAAWAKRYLGAVQDDVTQAAMTRFALMLAKGDLDLDLHLTAAGQLAGEVARIPGDQKIDPAMSKQRKREAKARKVLMSLCNHMVMCSLVDMYRDQKNLRWENLDVIETIMASVNGKGDDPAFANFVASKPPVMQGSRMQTPGAIHPDVLRIAISAAITERGLDRLVELMLANLNTDGSFRWTANAEQVFLATKHGEAAWQAVVQATSSHDDPRHSQAQAARLYVRKQFTFMPWLIGAVIDMCTPQRVAWKQEGHRAIIATAFEARDRAGLVPTCTFESVREASLALSMSLACALSDA